MEGILQVTGKRGPGQQRESHGMGRIHHLLGPLPLPGQVLVVEDGDRSAVLLEDLHDLLEEFVAGIECLPQFVDRILPVLADQEHPIHVQLVPAAAQRFGDGGVEGEAEFLRAGAAQVILRELVHVGRYQLEGGPVPPPLHGISHQEALPHVPGVGRVPPLGGHHGQPPGLGGLSPKQRWNRQAAPQGADKGASIDHELSPSNQSRITREPLPG